MSAVPGVPGVYTVQIYSKKGQAKVIGLLNEEMRKKLIKYMIYDENGPGGEEDKDWYRFNSNDNLVEVANYAKILYKYAVYNVIITGCQDDFINAGRYSVLYYVADTECILCIMEESRQKADVESFITSPAISGKKEVDWYRVDDTTKVKEIIVYTNGLSVRGITFNLQVDPFAVV